MKNTERNNRTTTCDFIKTYEYSKLFNIKYADTKHMSEYLMHSHVDDRKMKNNKLMGAMEIAHTYTHSFKHLQIHTFSHTPNTHRTEVLISVLWSPSKSRKQRNYTRFCKYYSSSRSLPFPFACNFFPFSAVLCFRGICAMWAPFCLAPRKSHCQQVKKKI